MGFDSSLTGVGNSAFISLILGTFFCCIYTPLCGYTVWRLCLRKGRRAYIFCLVLLWVLIIFTLVLDWLQIWPLRGRRSLLIDDYTEFDPSSWGSINNTVSTVVIIIADALLIHRCYTVCGENKWILIILSPFLIADTVCGIVELFPISPPSIPGQTIIRERPFDFGYFLIGLFLSSTLVTGVGTFLITHRILSATRANPSVASLTPYKRIQRIVIESGVVYSIGMLISGIAIAVGHGLVLKTNFTQSNSDIEEASFVVQTYSQALLTPLSGIAPTLIALRLVTQTVQKEEDETSPISHLTFNRRQSHTNTLSLAALHSFIQSGPRSKSLNYSNRRVHSTLCEEGPATTTIGSMEHQQGGTEQSGQQEPV